MAKRPGAGGIISLGIVFGVICAVAIGSIIRDLRKQSQANWKPVIVALDEIKPRTTITREMIDPITVPEKLVTPGALTKVEEVVGMIAKERIKPKEQIRSTDLVQKGQVPSLAYEIPPGKRAIAIGAGEVQSVGTAVKPGDRIDILATYHDPVSRQETTQMILQNVHVLAVNQGQTDPASGQGASSSMTLAVTPEEGELLTAADRAGVLRIQLRPLQDDTIVPSPGITVRDIPGGKGKIVEATGQQGERATPVIISPPPSRSRPEITVIRATQEQVVSP
jgi:pilus assembly protein CpaB